MFGDGGIRIPLLLDAGGLCRHPLTGAEKNFPPLFNFKGDGSKNRSIFCSVFP